MFIHGASRLKLTCNFVSSPSITVMATCDLFPIKWPKTWRWKWCTMKITTMVLMHSILEDGLTKTLKNYNIPHNPYLFIQINGTYSIYTEYLYSLVSFTAFLCHCMFYMDATRQLLVSPYTGQNIARTRVCVAVNYKRRTMRQVCSDQYALSDTRWSFLLLQ